jgi:mono/diheme cytochrome c family protein
MDSFLGKRMPTARLDRDTLKILRTHGLIGLVMVVMMVSVLVGNRSLAQDPPSIPPLTTLEEVREQIKLAGEEFKAKNFDSSSMRVEACVEVLETLILESDRKELPEWERVHRQVRSAADALTIQGAEFDAIPEWKEIQEKIRSAAKMKKEKKGSDVPKADESGIRFSKQIAPILVEHCGRCHVDKASGEFTMGTYEQLMKGSKAGVVLFPGDPVSSPLVSVIESGQMPPSGNRVPTEKLALIKAWVQQGAKYDESDPKASIKSFGGEGGASPRPPAKPVEVMERTGKETVSFSSDIAPLLVANCNGCHYAANNVRGGLRLNNFNEILKGGDSGAMIEPGKGDNSLLVKKLLGTSGQRMPAGGRPALSEVQINLVKKWIDEGASFDGDNRDGQLDSVIERSFAAKANHEELMQRRMERARSKWQIVAPNSKPDEAVDSEFHVIGNVSEAYAKKLLSQAQQVSKKLKRDWKMNAKDPFVKGGLTIFAFKSRYEYSEMGKMLEKRSIPAEWSAHWRKEAPDLYVAMVNDTADFKLNESTLVHQLTSVWVASHDGAPRWFAEGAGRSALAKSVGMNDARVQPWVRRAPAVIGELKNVQTLIEGKMNDEDEAVLGFGLIHELQSGPLKKKLEITMRQLATSTGFEEVFKRHFGPMDVFLKQALRKP